MCQDFPKLIEGKAVAKNVRLLSLEHLDTRCRTIIVHKVGALVFKNIRDFFEYMNEVEVLTNSLIQSKACLCFTGLNGELNCLQRLMNEYILSVKTNIASLLPQVRAGKVPAMKLDDVIKQNSLSPFCQERLSSLILEKEREIRQLEVFRNFFRQKIKENVIFAFEDGELDAIFDLNDTSHVVCFDFNIIILGKQ